MKVTTKTFFTITNSTNEYDQNYSEHRKNIYAGAHETVPFKITLNKQQLLKRFYQPGLLKIYIYAAPVISIAIILIYM